MFLEDGTATEPIDVLPGLIDAAGGRARVTAPPDPGAYRLFVYVHDGQGHAGHANIPFRVTPRGARVLQRARQSDQQVARRPRQSQLRSRVKARSS